MLRGRNSIRFELGFSNITTERQKVSDKKQKVVLRKAFVTKNGKLVSAPYITDLRLPQRSLERCKLGVSTCPVIFIDCKWVYSFGRRAVPLKVPKNYLPIKQYKMVECFSKNLNTSTILEKYHSTVF